MQQQTIKLYYQDSHKKEFKAQVLECIEQEKGYLVILDQTAFFPEGGGQASDTGRLGEAKVRDVKEKEGIIFHFTDKPLEKDYIVSGILDWERRFSFMQHHSGEHIVSGLIHQKFGLDNVGFHLGSQAITTLDINGVLSREQLDEIEEKANQAIYENIEIQTDFPDYQTLSALEYRSKKELKGSVRIVTIEGYDRCACCAPHVMHTGEIGIIKFTDMQKYKGGMRITMKCGSKALKDYQKKEKNNREISILLSSKPLETAEMVKKLKEEMEVLKNKCAVLGDKLIEEKVGAVLKRKEPICLFESDLETNELRRFCNRLSEEYTGICAVFGESKAEEWHYVIASKDQDVRYCAECLNQFFSGRGGGSSKMVQGMVYGKKEELKQFMESLQGEKGQ